MSNKSPSIDETFKSLERLKELQEGKKPKKKKPKAKKPKPLVEAQGGGSMKKGLDKVKALPKDKKRSARIKKKREALDPRDRIPQSEKLKRWMNEGVMGYNKYSPNAPLHPLDFKRSGGGKIKGYKKGGPITYRMTGGQVVGNSYD